MNMKKVFLLIFIIGTFSFTYAQSKQSKKPMEFIETYQLNVYPSSNSYVVTTQNRYYLETKSMIVSKQKELGKELLNEMLIYNQAEFNKAIKIQSEFNKAIKDKNLRATNMTDRDYEFAKMRYESRLVARLDSYRMKVLNKLDSYFTENSKTN